MKIEDMYFRVGRKAVITILNYQGKSSEVTNFSILDVTIITHVEYDEYAKYYYFMIYTNDNRKSFAYIDKDEAIEDHDNACKKWNHFWGEVRMRYEELTIDQMREDREYEEDKAKFRAWSDEKNLGVLDINPRSNLLKKFGWNFLPPSREKDGWTYRINRSDNGMGYRYTVWRKKDGVTERVLDVEPGEGWHLVTEDLELILEKVI